MTQFLQKPLIFLEERGYEGTNGVATYRYSLLGEALLAGEITYYRTAYSIYQLASHPLTHIVAGSLGRQQGIEFQVLGRAWNRHISQASVEYGNVDVNAPYGLQFAIAVAPQIAESIKTGINLSSPHGSYLDYPEIYGGIMPAIIVNPALKNDNL